MEIQSIPLKKLKEVNQFYSDITSDLRKKGVYQWDRFYPNRFVIRADLKKENLFGILADEKVVSAVTLNTIESKKYQNLTWEDIKGRALIIHRLAVHPESQGKGNGKKLLHFAVEYAVSNGYTSIRLDVYSDNQRAVSMYEGAGFQDRGIIHFPFRKVPFKCYEKIIG